MYRLYIDEVGTDDVQSVDADNERYLSLTGVAMKVDHARDELAPRMANLKAEIFGHDPDDPLILHRKKIVKRSGPFHVLSDPEREAAFNAAIISIFQECDYRVITALIDKRAMLGKQTWKNKEPYHYLMEVMVEKYTQFLERKGEIGDIMPEGRLGKKDERLQLAFLGTKARGTYYVSPARMAATIPSSNLKFRYKRDNIPGLQLADLIAHPSHILIRRRMGHEVKPGSFCEKVGVILNNEKYDRSNVGRIVGYGVKWLP